MSNALVAELSALNAAADTLRDRVTFLAGTITAAEHEHIVMALYEAERSLNSAGRHLIRAERLSRAVR